MATIREANDDTDSISASTIQKLDNIPNWIRKDYGTVLREELSPQMPPTRSMDHQIPLKPDMPPSFKGIFRLSQLELRELKRQLDQLLKGGKIKLSKSIRRTRPLCQKERRQTSSVYRLSSAQFPNNSKSLCVTTNR